MTNKWLVVLKKLRVKRLDSWGGSVLILLIFFLNYCLTVFTHTLIIYNNYIIIHTRLMLFFCNSLVCIIYISCFIFTKLSIVIIQC